MVTIPEFLKEYLADATLNTVTEGMSGAGVWRVEREGEADYYLKAVSQADDYELRQEADRLAWVASRFPAPTVNAFGVEAGQSYLLTTAIQGVLLSELLSNKNAITIVKGAGGALKRLHQLAIKDCPFTMELARRLALAEERLQAGEVELENFDEARQGQSAETVWAEVVAKRPATEDLVFTHGDFTPANVLINPDTLELSGVIDWGRAGIADRYQDLALMVRELETELQASFLEGYEVAQGLDWEKVAYYQLLDEFF